MPLHIVHWPTRQRACSPGMKTHGHGIPVMSGISALRMAVAAALLTAPLLQQGLAPGQRLPPGISAPVQSWSVEHASAWGESVMEMQPFVPGLRLTPPAAVKLPVFVAPPAPPVAELPVFVAPPAPPLSLVCVSSATFPGHPARKAPRARDATVCGRKSGERSWWCREKAEGPGAGRPTSPRSRETLEPCDALRLAHTDTTTTIRPPPLPSSPRPGPATARDVSTWVRNVASPGVLPRGGSRKVSPRSAFRRNEPSAAAPGAGHRAWADSSRGARTRPR